ncbi:hypothetical protein HZR84_01300 [Hyphobacterium sp. CCMP332]|nr:hypothetical protein HZR84_01300 [Hyphobacterium sp. CCMP332]
MDSKELYKLIEKPQSISEKQIEALDKIIQENPYFASARLIKILDLIRKKDPKVHQEIRNSSLFIHDKKSIYDEILKIEKPVESEIPLVNKGQVGLGENKIEKNDFTDEILDEITIIGQGVKSTVLESFSTNDIETPVEKSAGNPTKKSESEKKEDPKSSKVEPLKEEAQIKEIKKEESLPAKEDKKEDAAPAKALKKEEIPVPKEIKKENTPTAKRSLADEVMENLEQMKKDRAERLKRMEALEEKEKERKKASSIITKTKDKKAQKKNKEETPSQEIQKPNSSKLKKDAKAKSKATDNKSKSKTAKKKTESEPKKEEKESKPKSDKKIIESFINKSPRIKPPKESTSNTANEDLSKASTELPSNLISENLANIFEKQGKISKAIAIYKQLILKYPEKKSYFAQKLETLEK